MTRHDDLPTLLQRHADPEKAAWWSGYVKGASFLGVPMAETRAVALRWWDDLDDPGDPVGACLELGRHPVSEVKLAGVAIMEHRLVPQGRLSTSHLPRIRAALDAGAYADWNACDWMCVKVLGHLLTPTADLLDRPDLAAHAHAEVLGWSTSDTLWTRRASVVGFVNLLEPSEPSPGFDDAFLSTSSRLLLDERRFVQTAVGWTMRMFGRRRPATARAFLENHIRLISREALDNAAKALPTETRSSLVALHRAR